MRKKLFTLLLAMMASIGSLFAESGTCGENLTWDLTDGVLTISGTGAMNDYSFVSSNRTPWYNSRASITTVILSEGVTNIGENAFCNCSSLISVDIPNSVTSIGDHVFEGCSSLTSVEIPNSATSIGNYAFRNCTNLTYVTIPNSVTIIGEGAFMYCSSLTSITIPSSVTSIGAWAFSGCIATSIEIPNSVTSIGYHAFYKIPNIVYSGTATGSPWGARSVNGYVDGYLVYSDETKTNLLACCSTAEGDISIPNSVTSIENYAFRGCSSLTSVTIPNSVKIIGNDAFESCSSLTSITISNSVTSIGDSTFYKCSSLTSIMIPIGVTRIGDRAFSGCSSLTSVTLPESITRIGSHAFDGCIGLKAVHISDLAAWCKISFGYTYSNTHEDYGTNPLNYANNLYLNGTLITNLIIPSNVTSIGNYSFYGCTALTSVTIPNSVTSIGDFAFAGCNGLTAVYISNLAAWCKIKFGNYNPNGYAYANPLSKAHNLYLNESLITDLVIPDNVTSIGRYAFFSCRLNSVTIPNSITSISEQTFRAIGLKYVISLPSTPPTINYATFENGVTIIVNNTAINKYKNDSNWKKYNIIGAVSLENIDAPTSAVLSITNNIWSISNKYISSCGIEGNEQQPGNVLKYIGLEPNSEYNDIPVVLTSNTGETETVNVSFTTTALELTTQPSKTVSATTAILLAETNMSDAEVSCGFEYKRNDAPADMAGTKVFCPVASGQMAGRLKNLKDDVYYKYRAFYQSSAGNMYYGDWQYIFTGDVAVEFAPILYTYGATVVRENEATISGYALAGSEDFTEQGFEYWAESRVNGQSDQVPSTNGALRRMPAALNEHFFVQASGISLRVTLTNLDAGTVYKYRVYGKVGDQYYYGSEQSFTTTGTYTPPTYTITFANWDGTELQSSQVEEGTLPEYTGATPVRPEDEQYTYTFDGWSPAIVAATADATYTATYTATPKSQGIEDLQGDKVQCTKVLRDGQIFIFRGDKTYTLQGQEVR